MKIQLYKVLYYTSMHTFLESYHIKTLNKLKYNYYSFKRMIVSLIKQEINF